MKKEILMLKFVLLIATITFSSCDLWKSDFDKYDNGILEGTVWEPAGHSYSVPISFSKNAVYISGYVDSGSFGIPAGTYRSYFRDNTIHIDYEETYVSSVFNLRGVTIFYYSSNIGEYPLCIPASGKLFKNGDFYYLDGYTAKSTTGRLALIGYNGNQKNLTLPSELGGIPIVAIGDGESSPSFDQLTSIIIPDSIKTINSGSFISIDLFGNNTLSSIYLSGGITIGANVTIKGSNTAAGWDQGWGALDVSKLHDFNFAAYERNHLGYWLDMGFVSAYNSNGRKAGKYTWTDTYDSYNYKYTFIWSFEPR